jgi:hypothetical protein
MDTRDLARRTELQLLRPDAAVHRFNDSAINVSSIADGTSNTFLPPDER